MPPGGQVSLKERSLYRTGNQEPIGFNLGRLNVFLLEHKAQLRAVTTTGTGIQGTELLTSYCLNH